MSVSPSLLAASSGAATFVWIVVAVVEVVAFWRIFTKAGRPGWLAIIPLVNVYVLLKVVGRPGWWLILMFVPLLNIAIWILVSLDLAKSFGKTAAFAVGLVLLSFIFCPVLGFGSARYVGPRGSAGYRY